MKYMIYVKNNKSRTSKQCYL